MTDFIKRHWYKILIGAFFVSAFLVYLVFGTKSYIAVHDNLDLFVAQFQMLKNTDGFFEHGILAPFLHGVTRDDLPSELSVYNLLFAIFPSFAAYIIGYFLKIAVAILGAVLLAREYLRGGSDCDRGDCCGDGGCDGSGAFDSLVWLIGFAYGALNMFPAFGMCFASIPLAVWLMLCIYRKPRAWHYIALFAYPMLSYFSYFGLFLIAYLCVAWLWLSIRDKKVNLPLLLAIIVLSVGSVVCEYRLFSVMLFGDEITIRSTMVAGDLTFSQILGQIGDVLVNGMMHAESVHKYVVLPVCALYFVAKNISYIVQKKPKQILHDEINLLALVLLFNSVIYGIYYNPGFRGFVELLLPPLKGWQFNRTVFFSPFVWYAGFFVSLKGFCEWESSKKLAKKRWFGDRIRIILANLLALLAIAVILLSGTRYNDLYRTCKNQALILLKGSQIDDLNYEEFYSTELFEKAKAAIGYQGEWSLAYGFHPAVLEYNNIATLDGYLGFYSQEYKEQFRKIIAPALDRVEPSRLYYDEWGARAYLYGGTDLSVVSATKSIGVTDFDIYMDVDAARALDGKYLFSRYELTNADEVGLKLIQAYDEPDQVYDLYVYEMVGSQKRE